ncbi:MAG: adenylosuccinate synthetase [Candidatus Levybacteria bacterium]|nr:adenylosuccinate synthetase [Candidatus Levybacteria bacterium]
MAKGYSDVLIGLQYGDEGKARVIDAIADNYDIIARFNGGPNAGHTIHGKKGKLVLHQVPSGVFYPKKLLYVGSGCVINLEKLFSEIQAIQKLGARLEGRLQISDQISIIQPHHILIDERIGQIIGTTKNGIGPAYADKALRMDKERILNIRLGDILNEEKFFFEAIEKNCKKTFQEYGIPLNTVDVMMKNYKKAFLFIKPYIQTDSLYLNKLVENGKKILFEGAQSFMLDVTKGVIPYVTSSNTMAGSAYVGGDLSPKYHRKTIGVAKVIMSRVGNGPFVSEFGENSEKYCMENGGKAHTREKESNADISSLLSSDDPFEIGKALRILGDEYGSTTGRPRRIGMLDLVQLRYAVMSNGVDELWINKCDLLTDFIRTKSTSIPIITKYQLNKKTVDYVPSSNTLSRQIVPTIEHVQGFSQDLSEIRQFKALPKPLIAFVKMIEKHTGCRIFGIGIGSKREEYLLR